MSRYMIASEENMQALAHYGVRGMKWRQRKAMKNTAGMTAAMRSAATKGQNASIEAEKITERERAKERAEKTAKAIGSLVKGGVSLFKKGNEAYKNTATSLGRGTATIAESLAAPHNTLRAKDTIIRGGEEGGTAAVNAMLNKKKTSSKSSSTHRKYGPSKHISNGSYRS